MSASLVENAPEREDRIVPKPRLHCFAQSGNAYKVALFLELAGIDWEPVFVDFFNKATQAPSFRAEVNALGEIPVLERDGIMLTQSGAILQRLSDETGLFGGRDAEERYEILKWILFDNHKFTAQFATLRFLLAFAKTGETPVTEHLRGRVKAAWKLADAHLATRPFMVGERATIADLSMAGYVFYPEETGLDMAAFPHLAAWRDRIAALPGWKHPYDLMPGHPLPA